MKYLKKNIFMKRVTINRILALLVIATMLFGACTKETSNTRLAAKISTSQFKNVTSDSVTVVGFVVAAGAGFTEEGVVYNTSSAPTTSNSKIVFSGPTTGATYTVKIGGLAYATVYYARAYAISPTGTLYGEEVTFTTLPVVPTLTTAAFTAITGNAAAGGGNVTVAGGAAVTARGIAYGTAHNPVISGTKTSDGTGTGAFTSALTSLKGNTTYYVRAYATNAAGTGYGPEVNFTTLVDMPVVTTTAVTAVTKTSAVSGGAVTYDGGGTITARGLAWGMSANPTIAGTVILDPATGTGTFVSNLTALTKYTGYHVRAYATNSAGTAYGADVTFTTLADILTWYLPGDYVTASYPGSTFNNWDPANSPKVMSTISAGDKLEGYVYLANGSNNWKFATQPNWNGPNYANNDANGVLEPGKLDPNAKNNIASAAGYYKLNADATAMTYTALATTWGIIGNATPGGWSNDTPMSYDPAKEVWTVYATLSKETPPNDGLKFRANGGWDLNYGDNSANGSLESGGTNIGVAYSGDYAIVMDLSHPNAYTYSLTNWGLIGDATPGGWSTDTQMSWNSANKVWTVTVALVSGSGGKTFKFRANQGWNLNYGGLGTSDGSSDNYTNATTAPLGSGGHNLGVPGNVDGTYTVTFDPVALKATVTKN